MCKNMVGNNPGGNFLGGNFPGGSFMGGNFPGGSFPDTLPNKICISFVTGSLMLSDT